MYNQEERLDPHLVIQRKTMIDEFLTQIDIFKGLPRHAIKLIDKRIVKRKVKKGEQIISEFEEAQGVFFVDSGVVKLTKQEENGNEVIVCIKKKGEIFAEACLFNKLTKLYPATAHMLQDGELYFLSTEDLEEELMHSPEVAVQIIHYMSEQLHEMTSTLRDIALLDVYTKTVRTLEKMAGKFATTQCRGEIEIPLTVQEFSTLVGASRETVSRVFSKLRNQGILEMRGRKIVIMDWCKLCDPFYRH